MRSRESAGSSGSATSTSRDARRRRRRSRAPCARRSSRRGGRAASMRSTSGVVTPLTTGAPRPTPALTMRSSAPPLRARVRRPREHHAGGRRLDHPLDDDGHPDVAHAVRREVRERAPARDRRPHRRAPRRASASPPRTPSTLSARPAIETSAPSSHVALDRTARPHGERAPTSRQSARSSSASPRGSGALQDLLPRLGGPRVPGAPGGGAQERARLAPGRQLAQRVRERLGRQHDGVRHVEAVAHEPREPRRLAADDARIVAAAPLRERLERHEPRVAARGGAMPRVMRAMVSRARERDSRRRLRVTGLYARPTSLTFVLFARGTASPRFSSMVTSDRARAPRPCCADRSWRQPARPRRRCQRRRR